MKYSDHAYSDKEYFSLKDLRRENHENMHNCKLDLAHGAEFPVTIMSTLQKLHEQSFNLDELSKDIGATIILISPYCAIFLYDCEISGIALHKDSSKLYASIMASTGLKYIFDLSCQTHDGKDVAVMVCSSSADAAGGTMGVVLEIYARSKQVVSDGILFTHVTTDHIDSHLCALLLHCRTSSAQKDVNLNIPPSFPWVWIAF